MSQYHISRNGQLLGTFPEAEARQFFQQGRIALTDLVWRTGMSEWLPAGQVFGIPAPIPPDAPPLPPPLPPASIGGVLSDPAKPLPTEIPRAPDLHWAIVLLLGCFSFGIFFMVWDVIQYRWIKRIDPKSQSMKYLVIHFALLFLGSMFISSASEPNDGVGIGLVLMLASYVLWYIAVFKARRSMIDYYNSAEPIGLRLSVVMTLFFNVLYLQHHMSRIATWKRTGRLSPQ